MQAEGDQLFVDQRRIEQDRPWWYQTAREVRESDEYKVRDYKEDIDTLLVIVSLGFLLTRASSYGVEPGRVLYSPLSLQHSYSNHTRTFPQIQQTSPYKSCYISQISSTASGSMAHSSIPPFQHSPSHPSHHRKLWSLPMPSGLLVS